MRFVERLVGGAAGSRFFRRQRLVGEFRNSQAVGKLEGGLEAVGKPRCHIRPHHDAVDHDVDVVLVLLVESRHIRDLVELAIDLDALEALLS